MEPKKENTKTLQRNGAKIRISKNGPYLIYGELPIQKMVIIAESDGTATEWQLGVKYPQQKICSLCRCGQSKNKPFCDVTHTKVNFDGSENAGGETYLDEPKEFDGVTLKLTDTEKLCASARFCHRAGGIWTLVPESSDPKKKRIAIEEACDCPSGRLVILDKQAVEIIEPNLFKSIWVIEDPGMGVDGPIWVRGGIPVVSVDGKTYRIRNRVTLCRCGKSANKPFCDSSHYPEAGDVEKIHNE